MRGSPVDLTKPARRDPASAVDIALNPDTAAGDVLGPADLLDLAGPTGGFRRVRLINIQHHLAVLGCLVFQAPLETDGPGSGWRPSGRR